MPQKPIRVSMSNCDSQSPVNELQSNNHKNYNIIANNNNIGPTISVHVNDTNDKCTSDDNTHSKNGLLSNQMSHEKIKSLPAQHNDIRYPDQVDIHVEERNGLPTETIITIPNDLRKLRRGHSDSNIQSVL